MTDARILAELAWAETHAEELGGEDKAVRYIAERLGSMVAAGHLLQEETYLELCDWVACLGGNGLQTWADLGWAVGTAAPATAIDAPETADQTLERDLSWITEFKAAKPQETPPIEAHETAEPARTWDEPVPLRTYSAPMFPINALPTWLAEWCAAVAESKQVPIDAPALTALCALASTLQGKVRVQPRSDWTEPVNLYGVIVQQPAARYSAVQADAFRPLRAVEAERLRRAAADWARAAAEQAVAKARATAAATAAARSNKHEDLDEATSLAQRAAEFQMPKSMRMFASDITPEKLAHLMNQTGGCITVVSAEASIFGTIAGRYSRGTPNQGIWLDGHAGDHVTVDRVHLESSLSIPHPRITVCLKAQPGVLREIARDQRLRDSGLLARFVFACPDDNCGYRDCDPAEPDQSILDAYAERMRALAMIDVREEVVIPLTSGANALRIAWDRVREPRFLPGGDLASISDWAGKVGGLAMRFAGLLSVAGGGRFLPIDETTLGHAIACADWALTHAHAAFGIMGACEDETDAGRILAALKGWDRGSWIGSRDIMLEVRGLKAARITEAMAVLTEHGWCEPKTRKNPGARASQGWDLNPGIWA